MPQRDGSLEYQRVAGVVDRDRAVPVVGERVRVRGERVARVLVPRELARARHLAVELAQRPGEPAVDVEPDAARVRGGAGERRVRHVVEQQAEHVGHRARSGRSTGPCSVTSGSLRAGAIAEPIFDGPPGAPMPVRKRRMFATSVAACSPSGAPARIAHGCGSP